MAKDKDIKYSYRKGMDELCKLMNIPFDSASSRYKHLERIRVNPTPICLTNDETKEAHNFKSVYACGKYFKINSGFFGQKKKYKKRSNEIVIDGIK